MKQCDALGHFFAQKIFKLKVQKIFRGFGIKVRVQFFRKRIVYKKTIFFLCSKQQYAEEEKLNNYFCERNSPQHC
jgi:hypothetical protein